MLWAQLGVKHDEVQLHKDLAHQGHATKFTLCAARGALGQEAASTGLLHQGEQLPALELMAVLLWKCHSKATLGSRSETHSLSN